jgi:hypothetical protein
MCFDVLWFVHLIILIAFVVALIAIAQIWLPTWTIDARLLATLRVLIGLLIFCAVVWILYSLYVCMVGGGGYLLPRAR